jgi:hypothetical protein
MDRDEVGRNPDQLRFGLVRIGEKAALDDTGGAGISVSSAAIRPPVQDSAVVMRQPRDPYASRRHLARSISAGEKVTLCPPANER